MVYMERPSNMAERSNENFHLSFAKEKINSEILEVFRKINLISFVTKKKRKSEMWKKIQNDDIILMDSKIRQKF